MEEEYAIVLYVQLTPDILVPNEWPLRGVYNVILKLAKEIIMQSDHEDPILQVNGIPARIGRYVDKGGFYYVFHKISKQEMCGSYVYDVTLRGDVSNNRPNESSGTASCTGLCMSDDCFCSMNYVVACYQAPSRSSKRKILDINPDAYVAHRRSVKRMCQIPEECDSNKD